jgi:hypothetical protein
MMTFIIRIQEDKDGSVWTSRELIEIRLPITQREKAVSEALTKSLADFPGGLIDSLPQAAPLASL